MLTPATLRRGALPCAVFLVACCLFAAANDKEPAPRFTALTTTGEKFDNASVKGKAVLLEFWATWSSYCANEANFVDKIGQELAPKGLILLAIGVGDSKKQSKGISSNIPATARLC